MINHTAMKAAFKLPYMRLPTEFTAEVRTDMVNDVITVELPSGAKLALQYSDVKNMVERIEAHREAKKD